MFCKKFLISSLILLSVIITFGGCKEAVTSKDQIITQKIIDACKKSDSKSCLTDAIDSRTERYCSGQGLSKFDCNNVKLEVIRALRAQQDKEYEEINREIEIKRKQNSELQQQNEEADKILRK